jgi:hypothetical protein
MYVGASGMVFGLGSLLGPVIGGAFSDSSATWRWGFYINVCVYGLLWPIHLFVFPSANPRPDLTLLQKFRKIDYLGSILNVCFWVFFILGFTFGGSAWNWNSGGVIACFTLSGVSLIVFAVQQTYCIGTTPEERIFPFEFLRHRTQYYLAASTVTAGVTFMLPLYFVPLYFEFTRGIDGIGTSVKMLPFICLSMGFMVVNGIFMPKTRVYWPWYLAAGVLQLTGASLLFANVDASTSSAKLYGYSILIGIGSCLTQVAAFTVSISKMGPQHAADVNSLFNTMQVGGFLIGLTLAGTIFENRGFHNLTSALAGSGLSPADIRQALAGFKNNNFIQSNPEFKAKAIDGIASAISDGYAVAIAAGCISTITALLMKREKLILDVNDLINKS